MTLLFYSWNSLAELCSKITKLKFNWIRGKFPTKFIYITWKLGYFTIHQFHLKRIWQQINKHPTSGNMMLHGKLRFLVEKSKQKWIPFTLELFISVLNTNKSQNSSLNKHRICYMGFLFYDYYSSYSFVVFQASNWWVQIKL